MKVSERLTERLFSKEPLSRHSSFKIGGIADWYAEPNHREELLDLFEFAEGEGIPFFLIGKASNILFADEGFRGMVISLGHLEPNRILFRGPFVTVSAGTSLVALAQRCAQAGLGGIEFLGTIPGTVGGAVAMNAGFSRHPLKTHDASERLYEVCLLQRDGRLKTLGRNGIDFSYRKSSLEGEIILEVTFLLEPVDPAEAQRELRANSEYRERVQDLRFPSAGSVFKNPKGESLSVGRMIEQLGLKGMRAGGAQISEKHGNFIVNRGRATAREVLELAERMRESVKKAFGVELELEIKVVGGG